MFQPIVVGTGLVAWRNLQRSMPVQQGLFANDAQQKRLTDHFSQNAKGVRAASEIVDDRRMREVALTAFGLGDDLNNRFLVQRILEGGTADPSALANRLSDSRYRVMAEEFGFDGLTPIVGLTQTKVDGIVDAFQNQAFEEAVGEVAPSLRLALNTDRELARIGALDISDNAKWFLVMGNPPLRQVMETALGLPSSFGRLPLDQQLSVFREKSGDQLNAPEVSDLTDQETRDKLIDRFLLREQVQLGASLSPMNVALQLLQF